MKRTNNQSGQVVIQEVMNYTEQTKSDAIKERKVDIYQAGILKNSQQLGESQEFLFGTTGFFLSIGTGVAYNEYGERVLIDTTGAAKTYDVNAPATITDDGTGAMIDTPQLTGSANIDYSDNILYPIGDYYVYITYLEVINNSSAPGTFSLHKVTNAKLFTQHEDGFIIYPYGDLTTPSIISSTILLGIVTKSSTGISVVPSSIANRIYSKTLNQRIGINIDSTKSPTTYADTESKFVDDHINALGSGTVTPTNPHALTPTDIGVTEPNNELFQKETHANGIITPDSTTTNSAFYSSIPSGDHVLIMRLIAAGAGTYDEAVYIEGKRFDYNNMPGANFDIDFGVTGLNLGIGTYVIYTSSTLTGGKMTMTVCSEADFLLWTKIEQRQKLPICKINRTSVPPPTNTAITDMRYFLFPVRTSTRTYTGHADISDLVSEKVYIHIEGILQRARLYLWAETFDKHHYSEMPEHTHSISVADFTGSKTSGSSVADLRAKYTTNNWGTEGDSNSDLRMIYHFASNIFFNVEIATSSYQIKSDIWVGNHEFKLYDAGHTHSTVITHGHAASATPMGTVTTVLLSATQKLLISSTFKIKINTIDRTVALGMTLPPAVADTELLNGKDITQWLNLGKNTIEFIEDSLGYGGRIRYNVYIE